jgi:hypothetical protein
MRVAIWTLASVLALSSPMTPLLHSVTRSGTCSVSWISDCEASTDGTSVDVTGEDTRPGTTPDRTDPSPGRPDAPVPAPTPECLTPLCRGGYEVASLPEVTIEDLASFVPATPALTGEPLGLGVVRMPTNVVATASEQRLSGTLFGYAVTVRFVPTAFRFDYGDGAARTATTGGASWDALGQAEFTPTPTSHVYTAPGTYPVRVTTEYSASVDFGTGSWRPVPGVVRSTSPAYGVRVVEVRTALVDRTCLEDPHGPAADYFARQGWTGVPTSHRRGSAGTRPPRTRARSWTPRARRCLSTEPDADDCWAPTSSRRGKHSRR